MTETSSDIAQILRERGVRYIVDAEQRPVAVLLTPEEYEHYLDLLDDESDSRDEGLAIRLAQAANRSPQEERLSLQDYLRQRQGGHA